MLLIAVSMMPAVPWRVFGSLLPLQELVIVCEQAKGPWTVAVLKEVARFVD